MSLPFAGLLCGGLAVLSASAMLCGLSRLERAYPQVADRLSRYKRERFLKALSQCRKAFMIGGFGLCLLEAVIMGLLAFGPDAWVAGAEGLSAASAFPVGYFLLLVRKRNAQLSAFLEKIAKGTS